MDVFFKSWDSIVTIIITTIFAYPGLIILLRIFGKRSLSKLNMFDFIITVALGSTFASIVISKSVTIVDGLITFAFLLFAQFLVTSASLNLPFVDRLIKSEPTLLFRNGHFLENALQAERVTQQEVFAEVRQKGFACLDDVYAVVLETNGMMSILGQKDKITRPTLVEISNYEPEL